MLVGLGAYKAIGGVATGDVLGRLHQATAQVQRLARVERLSRSHPTFIPYATFLPLPLSTDRGLASSFS